MKYVPDALNLTADVALAYRPKPNTQAARSIEKLRAKKGKA